MTACQVEGCSRRHEARGYCHSHFERVRRGKPAGGPFPETALERLMLKVEVDGDCWLWTAGTDGDGRYGAVYNSTTKKLDRAHRRAYELLVGPIPVGLVTDHLCRQTLCVNPDHLDLVTQHENIMRGGWGGATNARKTHCKHGHEFTPENTLTKPSGHRACKTCTRRLAREATRRYRARQRRRQAVAS